MSGVFHRLYRQRLCRGPWRDRLRPVLLNSWEAFQFSIDEEKCLALAKQAAELGIELFVLDDGWFRNRIDDRRALGDWTEDPDKFPHGLARLADQVRAAGVAFGIWFEPEMVSYDSDLYRSHPDWVIRSRPVTPSSAAISWCWICPARRCATIWWNRWPGCCAAPAPAM